MTEQNNKPMSDGKLDAILRRLGESVAEIEMMAEEVRALRDGNKTERNKD